MNDELKLRNRLKEARFEKKLSQSQLAEMVGVSRNTISSIETDNLTQLPSWHSFSVSLWTRNLKNYFIFREITMDHLLLLILGIFLSTLGTVNIKGNISTIHSYNRRKVKEEDVPKYGKAVGTGTLVIGVSLMLSYLVTFWNTDAIDYIVLPALVIGLAFILYGQIKYNHGIF